MVFRFRINYNVAMKTLLILFLSLTFLSGCGSSKYASKNCKYGYYKIENSCYKLPSDASAYKFGDDFFCKNGKYKKGNICVDDSSSNSLNVSNNSNTSSGHISSFGNAYAYDLSNPSDQLRYKTDPAAQLRDRTSNQYIKELESILGEFGGGVFQKNNSPSWNNNMWNNNMWNNNSWNNNSPTWDWVN